MTGPAVDLEVVGVVLVALGVAHVALPRVLGWQRSLVALATLDREVNYVHSYFIGLTCVLWGLFPLVAGGGSLAHNSATTFVLVGATVFWVARLVVQLVVFNRHASESAMWRTASVGGTLLWLWIAGAWIWALCAQLHAR